MAEYEGLILSCRQVYREYESEVLDRVHHFLDIIQQDWTLKKEPLILPRRQNLGDTINMGIIVPQSIHLLRPEPPHPFSWLRPLCQTLADNLPSFSVCLEGLPKPWPVDKWAYDIRYRFSHGVGEKHLLTWKYAPDHRVDRYSCLIVRHGEYEDSTYDPAWPEGVWSKLLWFETGLRPEK